MNPAPSGMTKRRVSKKQVKNNLKGKFMKTMKRLVLIVILLTAMPGWAAIPAACYKMDDNADSNIVIDSQGFSHGTAQ